jgi:hypothetical protein
MGDFIVPIVDRDLLRLWHEFNDSKEPSKEAVEASRGGALGRSVHIEANSKREAAIIAERENPYCAAIRDAIQRV